MFKAPEKFRIKKGAMGSDESYGNNGAFEVKSLKLKVPLIVVCSDELGWDHVSVSLKTRTPTWDEMCFIKDLFWSDDDVVMQLHPIKENYVNNHPYCLHLWRPQHGHSIPSPPLEMVGIKGLQLSPPHKRGDFKS